MRALAATGIFILSTATLLVSQSADTARWSGRKAAIALTYDDGPNPVYTPRLMKILEQYNARATFFLIGMWAEREPELIRELHAAGHAIGNHTFSHPRMPFLSMARVTDELARCRAADEASGVELTRIEAASYSEAAPERLESPVLTIEPGRTGNVAYESTGYVGDDPFIVMRVGWYLTPVMRPEGVTAECQWILSVEGRPSTRTVLSVEPTLTNTDTMLGEPGAPGYVGFGICLIQAIPAVVDAPAGVLPTDVPRAHYRRDLRGASALAAA